MDSRYPRETEHDYDAFDDAMIAWAHKIDPEDSDEHAPTCAARHHDECDCYLAPFCPTIAN